MTMLILYTFISFVVIASAAPASSFTGSASASVPTTCHAKTFDIPWILRDITIYQASGQDSTDSHGAVSFQFCDENEGLKMQTDCSGTIINGRCEAGNGGYVLCADQNVAFKVAYDLILVERAYMDNCLGPPPYNSGMVFGQNNTQMTTISELGGTLRSQKRMLVEITAMT